jgi:hypothetical protein
MENNWVRIFRTMQPIQAELLKGMLEENEINVVLLNKHDSAFQVGEAELYVSPDDEQKALALIQNTEHENPDNAQ